MTPSFSLILQKDTITTEYNECGFEKHNVRALTAIGESTKEKLLGGEQDIIGEKGLGFKAVFAVASKVSIFRGDFNFCLTDRDPTIPRNVKPPSKKSQGTKMEVVLKGKPLALSYDKENLLTLCLCLRKLKELTIAGHHIQIELTTSREEVNPSSDAWNSYVRREAYRAILDVMETLKTTKRARILKFVNYVQRWQCRAPVYVNSTFACDYLNAFDFLSLLGDKEILPTYDKNVFTTPRSGDATRFSDAVNFLFRKGNFGSIASRQAIDLGGNQYDAVLNALKCTQQAFDREYQILNQYIGTYMEDSGFREAYIKI